MSDSEQSSLARSQIPQIVQDIDHSFHLFQETITNEVSGGLEASQDDNEAEDGREECSGDE